MRGPGVLRKCRSTDQNGTARGQVHQIPVEVLAAQATGGHPVHLNGAHARDHRSMCSKKVSAPRAGDPSRRRLSHGFRDLRVIARSLIRLPNVDIFYTFDIDGLSPFCKSLKYKSPSQARKLL